jgi:hypothetical protein
MPDNTEIDREKKEMRGLKTIGRRGRRHKKKRRKLKICSDSENDGIDRKTSVQFLDIL